MTFAITINGYTIGIALTVLALVVAMSCMRPRTLGDAMAGAIAGPLAITVAVVYWLAYWLARLAPVLAVFLLPLTAFAQPAPGPDCISSGPHANAEYCGIQWKAEASASTAYLYGEGVDRIPVFGSRIEASARLGRLILAGRLLASALRDGVDIDNPKTYSTLEAHGLVAFDVVGPVAVAAVYGITRPSIGEDGPTCETWGVGGIVGDGTGDRWLLVVYGKHDATAGPPSEQIGPGIRPSPERRLLGALKYRLKDRTAVVVDGAPFGAGRMIRVGIALRILD